MTRKYKQLNQLNGRKTQSKQKIVLQCTKWPISSVLDGSRSFKLFELIRMMLN